MKRRNLLKVIVSLLISGVFLVFVFGSGEDEKDVKYDYTCCTCSGTGKVNTSSGYDQCSTCYGLGKLRKEMWESHCAH